jgi:acyl carrier protein
MTRDELQELIVQLGAEIVEREPGKIDVAKPFKEQDFDSLAMIETVEAIEAALRELGHFVRISDDDLEDLKTPRDAVDYIWVQLEAAD